jgi:hypothetical protein
MFALDARQVTKHEGLTTDYETVALPAELRRQIPSEMAVFIGKTAILEPQSF